MALLSSSSPPPPPLPSLDDGGSGSVMAEMTALFTPPGRDSKRHGLNPKPVELHPYFRRPGKGHNHDSCDACGEGGDLICCDHCPASFHFSCHAPPLEEDDIPMGDWMCLRCYVREQGRLCVSRAAGRNQVVAGEGAALAGGGGGGGGGEGEGGGEVGMETASGDGNGGENGNGKGSSKFARSRFTRGSSGGATLSSSLVKKQAEAAIKVEKVVKIYRQKYDWYLAAKPVTNTPFDKLVAATQVLNAEQFCLPIELQSRESLPFSWKWSDERQDDFDAYPKLCFACSKTSRNVPSVGCDFCPNVYHLDCLNPPLCEIPKERWMCPAHPEHLIDSKLVGSTSLTERLRLWNKYARSPVDTESVRLEFFRKARSGRLFQKSGQRTANTESRIKVPQFVKDQYRLPLPKLPTAIPAAFAQPPPLDRGVRENGKAVEEEEEEEEENEFLASLISLQESILREKSRGVEKWLTERGRKRRKSEDSNKKGKRQQQQEKRRRSESKGGSPASDDVTTDSDCSVDMEEEEGEGDPALPPNLREALNLYLSRRLRGGRGGFSLGGLSPVVRDFLAAQRLRELLPEDPKTEDTENEVRARAALLPLHCGPGGRRRRNPFLMRYRTLNIGSGSAANQLDLSTYGHCNFVSAKHATVYFDQHSQVYELINYSEHGTVVDNAVYALNCRPVASLRNSRSGPEFVMSAGAPAGRRRACHCETSISRMLSEGVGCENSAVLHHGSLIRIGCHQFVFSVVVDDSPGRRGRHNEPVDEEPKLEEEEEEGGEKKQEVKKEVEEEPETKEVESPPAPHAAAISNPDESAPEVKCSA